MIWTGLGRYTTGGAQCGYATMRTRYADEIVLGSFHQNYDDPDQKDKLYLQKHIDSLYAKVKLDFPNIRILEIPYGEPQDFYDHISECIDVHYYYIAENEFNPERMKRYVDERGKIYLLTEIAKHNKKIAYTIADDRVMRDYTFKSLVDKIPLMNIQSKDDIYSKYYLVAL